jgi:Holliday junction resolvase RusA-like endonuclease
MPEYRWYELDLNPEPWAIGPLGVNRKGGLRPFVGRNQQLFNFQEAVKEAMNSPQFVPEMIVGDVALIFYFWRQRAEYTTPQARTHRKHEADTTNMQKALEDALQGVLYKNDKDVKFINSIQVAQGPDVRGKILVGAAPWHWETDLPEEVKGII